MSPVTIDERRRGRILGPAVAAVDALAQELAAFIPVTNEDDLLTRFLDAYTAAAGDGV